MWVKCSIKELIHLVSCGLLIVLFPYAWVFWEKSGSVIFPLIIDLDSVPRDLFSAINGSGYPGGRSGWLVLSLFILVNGLLFIFCLSSLVLVL